MQLFISETMLSNIQIDKYHLIENNALFNLIYTVCWNLEYEIVEYSHTQSIWDLKHIPLTKLPYLYLS